MLAGVQGFTPPCYRGPVDKAAWASVWRKLFHPNGCWLREQQLLPPAAHTNQGCTLHHLSADPVSTLPAACRWRCSQLHPSPSVLSPLNFCSPGQLKAGCCTLCSAAQPQELPGLQQDHIPASCMSSQQSQGRVRAGELLVPHILMLWVWSQHLHSRTSLPTSPSWEHP